VTVQTSPKKDGLLQGPQRERLLNWGNNATTDTRRLVIPKDEKKKQGEEEKIREIQVCIPAA